MASAKRLDVLEPSPIDDKRLKLSIFNPKEVMMDDKWLFNLDDRATLTSGEEGVIIGRAEYTNSTRNYLLRYKAGDGRLTEAWWTADAFVAGA